MSGAERLVRMANQIARNFEIHGSEAATSQTATHIKKFWAPSMREDINAHIEAGAEGLSEIALAALQALKAG